MQKWTWPLFKGLILFKGERWWGNNQNLDCNNCDESWRSRRKLKVNDCDESLGRSPLGTLGRCSSAERYFASLHNQDRVQFLRNPGYVWDRGDILYLRPEIYVFSSQHSLAVSIWSQKVKQLSLKEKFNLLSFGFWSWPWFRKLCNLIYNSVQKLHCDSWKRWKRKTYKILNCFQYIFNIQANY